MARKNDYDDLTRDIAASGQSWSPYDMDLAKRDPDAGRSLYTQKDLFGKAGTDADRQAAHDAAEAIRQRCGGYSGGGDGGGFTLSDKYAPPAETYDPSKYGAQIDQLMAQLLGRDPFSYSPGADPSYQAYSEQYRNLGRQAREDALGSAAAMTGGMPSSYALTAGQQAQNAYNARLSDKIPELEQLAHEMYLGDLGQKRADLSALQGLDETEYGRFRDQRGDRLENWRLNHQEDETAYGREQDQYNRDVDRAGLLAAAGDYSGFASLWGLSPEQTQALVGDYARTKDLTEAQAARDLADWHAQYGDFSKAKELGVDTSFSERQQAAQFAPRGYSGGGGGNSPSDGEDRSADYDTVAKQAARYKDIGEAKAYLERMVDTGRIKADEAAYIYQVQLGGVSVPTSYEEFSAVTGFSGIMTLREFQRAKASGGGRADGYANYQDYLAKMYEKYK